MAMENTKYQAVMRNMYCNFLTIIILLMNTNFCSCENTKKDNNSFTNKNMKIDSTIDYSRKFDTKTGIEVYDKETFKNNSKGNSALLKTKDGWTILMGNITESGAIVYEYPPLPNSYITQKIFYPNGKLKQVCSYYQEKLMVGISKYYDEKGNLIQVVDEVL